MHTSDGESVAIDVGVVGQQCRCCNQKGRIFVGHYVVVNSDWRVVHRIYCQINSSRRSSTIAVAHCVGEGCRAVIIGRGCESNIRPGQADSSVCRALHTDDSQCVAVDVRIVGQQRCCCDYKSRIFVGHCVVVDSDWRVVHGVHCEIHRRGRCSSISVTHGVSKRCRTVVVGRRRKGDVRSRQDDSTIGCVLYAGYGQCIAVDVRIVR